MENNNPRHATILTGQQSMGLQQSDLLFLLFSCKVLLPLQYCYQFLTFFIGEVYNKCELPGLLIGSSPTDKSLVVNPPKEEQVSCLIS